MIFLSLLVSLATLAVGRKVKANKSYIPFAFLVSASGFRVFLVSNLIWDYFPSFSLSRKYDLEYLSLFMVAAAYYAFTCALFHNGRPHTIDKIMYGICALCSIFTLFVTPFLPPGTVTLLREPFQIFCLLMGLTLTGITLQSMFSGAIKCADALGQAIVRAEESVRAKSEFIATMSHELRTPLNAVVGFSEIMRLEVFRPLGAKKYIEYANDINASGTHLLAVVNDVVDLSRIETGNDELHEEVLRAEGITKLVLSLSNAS